MKTKNVFCFLKFAGDSPHSIVLADLLTKGFFQMVKTEAVTYKGGNTPKMLDLIKSDPNLIQGYEVIVLHLGTNWLSGMEEWGLYLKMVNKVITKESYNTQLRLLNPPPALGKAQTFKDQYQELIDLIKFINKEVTILVSSIIPRSWDHDRRHPVRNIYNKILKSFNKQSRVFFIPSFRPFFDANNNLKCELFDHDGLHLSDRGAVVLRTFFCEKIDKCRQGILK